MTLCSESIPDENGKCFDSNPTSSSDPYFFLFMSQTVHITQTCSVPKTEQFRVHNRATLGQLVLHIRLMEIKLDNEVGINLVSNL